LLVVDSFWQRKKSFERKKEREGKKEANSAEEWNCLLVGQAMRYKVE